MAALAASVPAAIWDGDAPPPPPLAVLHPDHAGHGDPLNLPHLHMLPVAHADPHYWPCVDPLNPPGKQVRLENSPDISFHSTDDGEYGIGDMITVRIYHFQGFNNINDALDHTRLALETGDVDRFATYDRSAGATYYYTYTVQPGDYSADLDYKAANSLHWGTGPTRNAGIYGSGSEINCWLSTPGTSDYRNKASLAENHNVIVDGIIPRVVNVTMPGGAYGAGTPVNVTVNFDEPIIIDAPPSLALALDDENRTIPYLHGNETSSLVFNYTVRAGDLADALGYAGAGALATGGNMTDAAGNNASLALPSPGTPGSLGATSSVSITAASGGVVGVGSPLPGGTYPEGRRIEAVVSFNEPVVYTGTPPSLVLGVGGANRTAEYASGNDTRQLAFHYTVRQGDADADGLEYASGALQVGADGLRDRAGDAVDTALTDPGPGGPLSHIRIGTSAAAYVTGVDSPGGNSTYGQSDTVAIAVEFSAPVTVAGAPVLALATEPPRNATYAGATATATTTLEFQYAVEPGDAAPDLDYAGTAALHLAGNAEIRHGVQGGDPALLSLPVPGTPGSLGHSRNIVIDGDAPSVLRVDSPNPSGTHGTGRIVDITVSFDEPVHVKGIPAIGLATAPERNATYASGSGTNALSFLYAVQPGDSAAALNYAGRDALALGGGGAAIRDAAGNAANLSMPAPAPEMPLATPGTIEVHGGPLPVLASVPGGWASDAGDPGLPPLFGELNNAHGVAAFSLGENNDTYAVVASSGDHGVQLIRIQENGTLEAAGILGDNSTLELEGAIAVDVIDMGENKTYAIVASIDDDGVQAIRILENGTLEAAGMLDNNSDRELNGARSVDAFWTAGGNAYAIVASVVDSGVQLIRIQENGTLEAPQGGNLADNGTLVLGGAGGVAAFRTANGSTLALVASYAENGVQLVQVHEDGRLAAVGSPLVSTQPGLGRLANAIFASAVRAPDGSNSTLVMVATEDRNHVQLIRVHDDGTMVAAGRADDGPPFDTLGRAKYADFFEMGGRTYAAIASLADDGVQLVRVHGNGTLEAAGSAVDGQDGFAELDGAHGIDVFEMNDRTYAIVASRIDNGVQLIRLSPASVENVTSTLPGGTHREGRQFNVTVGFDAPVSVSGPPPSLLLALGGGGKAAEYLEGGGTRSLVFNYTVQPGDNADRLAYAGAGALVTRGAVTDVGGTGRLPALFSGPPPGVVVLEPVIDRGPRSVAAADLALPAPGMPGSLETVQNARIDALQPSVKSVGSPDAGGAYGAGSRINVTVAFTEAVSVTGTPLLWLSTDPPRSAEYVPGSDGDAEIAFRYTVEDGDSAERLGYAGRSALTGDGSIRDLSGNDADRTLPPPGVLGLLGASAGIRIDTEPPRVASVAEADPKRAAYVEGDTVRIAVALGEAVELSPRFNSSLQLALDGGRTAFAWFDRLSGDNRTLVFNYAVQSGDAADPLDYDGADALSITAGTLADAAGNAAVLDLSDVDPAASLRASGIVIGGTGDGQGGTGDGQGGTGDGQGGTGDGTGDGQGGTGDGTGDGQGGTGDGTGDGQGGNATTTHVVVVGPDGIAGPGNLTGRGDGARIEIDVSRLAGAGAGGAAVFPPTVTVVTTSFASVSFPPGVTATSVPADGRLALYVADAVLPDAQVQARLSYDGSGRVVPQRVVEIGGENRAVEFSMPVRISLEGQAGGRAFYIEGANGTISPIDTACAADDAERVHRQLGGAGECRIDSGNGADMVIYTYHLTRFGTAASELGTPPPVAYTCSLRLGATNLAVDARPGAASEAVRQDVVNTGSQPFVLVDLDATPWYVDPDTDRPGPGAPSLPAGITVVSTTGQGGTFVPLLDGGAFAAPVAPGLAGGLGLDPPLWLKINLTAYDQIAAGRLVQHVTYTAECGSPQGR